MKHLLLSSFITVLNITFSQNIQQVGITNNFKIALGTSLTMGETNEPIVIFADSSQNFKASVIKFDGNSWNYVGQPGFSSYPLVSVTSYTETVSPYQTFRYVNSFSINSKLISDGNTGYYIGVLENGGCTVYHFDGTTWQSVFNEPQTVYWGSIVSIDIAINDNSELICGYTSRGGNTEMGMLRIRNVSNQSAPSVVQSQQHGFSNIKIIVRGNDIIYSFLSWVYQSEFDLFTFNVVTNTDATAGQSYFNTSAPIGAPYSPGYVYYDNYDVSFYNDTLIASIDQKYQDGNGYDEVVQFAHYPSAVEYLQYQQESTNPNNNASRIIHRNLLHNNGSLFMVQGNEYNKLYLKRFDEIEFQNNHPSNGTSTYLPDVLYLDTLRTSNYITSRSDFDSKLIGESIYSVFEDIQNPYSFKVIKIDTAFSTLSTNEIQTNNSFSLHPNPATSQVKISFQGNSSESPVSIYNTTGQLVYEEKLVPNGFEGAVFSLNKLNAGVYYVKIGSLTQKLIIE